MKFIKENQLDQTISNDLVVKYIDPKKKTFNFKYNFLGARDKDINKIIDLIKKKFPYITDVDLSFIDELELFRKMKQNGTLNNGNNIIYLYCVQSDGKVLLKNTKNKNTIPLK